MANKENGGMWIVGVFLLLYVWMSIISTFHAVEFFKITNPDWLAWANALAYEIGAAASLAAIFAMKRLTYFSKFLVVLVFMALTFMQSMGNMYYAYIHAENYTSWVEMIGLVELEELTGIELREQQIYEKRILAWLSGGLLPIIAVCFIKSMTDYLGKNNINDNSNFNDINTQVPAIPNENPEEVKSFELPNQQTNSVILPNIEDLAEAKLEVNDFVTNQQTVVESTVEPKFELIAEPVIFDESEIIKENSEKDVVYTEPKLFLEGVMTDADNDFIPTIDNIDFERRNKKKKLGYHTVEELKELQGNNMVVDLTVNDIPQNKIQDTDNDDFDASHMMSM